VRDRYRSSKFLAAILSPSSGSAIAPPVEDLALGIAWRISVVEALVSDKDRKHPVLPALPRFFDHKPMVVPQAKSSG
jgi:hypothetical protein